VSDYTPTTEEVREYYAPARVSGTADETLRAEFDCWLAEVKEAEMSAERERIIALLKKHHRETKGKGELATKYEAAVLQCIALIKGENK